MTEATSAPLPDESLYVPMGRLLSSVPKGMRKEELAAVARSVVSSTTPEQIERVLVRMRDLEWITLADGFVLLTPMGRRFIEATLASNRPVA